MDHHHILPEFSFAVVKASALPSPSDETTKDAGTGGSVVPLEMEGPHYPNNNCHNLHEDENHHHQQQQQQHGNTTSTSTNHKNKNHRPLKLKKLGKQIGGAISKINIAKWIDDLEQDQHLADQLDRINCDAADEQERQEICRQAMEACLSTMREHLVEFIVDNPQGTYEEWISKLHPDNINGRMEGLTQTPLIDHRFYVADSDHRILWNAHLNDFDDENQESSRNLTPIRHFVPARSFNQPSDPRQQQQRPEQSQQEPSTAEGQLICMDDVDSSTIVVNSNDNKDSHNSQQNEADDTGGTVDLISFE